MSTSRAFRKCSLMEPLFPGGRVNRSEGMEMNFPARPQLEKMPSAENLDLET